MCPIGMQTAQTVKVRIIALECPSYNGSGSHWLHLFDFSPLCIFKWNVPVITGLGMRQSGQSKSGWGLLWKLRNVWKTCPAGSSIWCLQEKIHEEYVWGEAEGSNFWASGSSRAWQIYWRLVYRETSVLYKSTIYWVPVSVFAAWWNINIDISKVNISEFFREHTQNSFREDSENTLWGEPSSAGPHFKEGRWMWLLRQAPLCWLSAKGTKKKVKGLEVEAQSPPRFLVLHIFVL